MLYNKQKQLIKNIFVGLVFCLSLGVFNSGHIFSTKVAAYTCDPTKAACCQLPTDANAMEACKSSYIVVNNNAPNTNPVINHCYNFKVNYGTVPLYVNADCGTAPFNVSTTTFKHSDAPNDCSGPDLKANVKDPTDPAHCGILDLLVTSINVLSALVGVVIVAVIVVSGIQFSAAGNDPQKVAAARGHIINALLALVVFIFMYAFLQWVVPGGIF